MQRPRSSRAAAWCALALVAACTKTPGWSAEERQNARELCLTQVGESFELGKAQAYCGCLVAKTIEQFPNYADADKLGTGKDGDRLADECVDELHLTERDARDRQRDPRRGVRRRSTVGRDASRGSTAIGKSFRRRGPQRRRGRHVAGRDVRRGRRLAARIRLRNRFGLRTAAAPGDAVRFERRPSGAVLAAIHAGRLADASSMRTPIACRTAPGRSTRSIRSSISSARCPTTSACRYAAQISISAWTARRGALAYAEKAASEHGNAAGLAPPEPRTRARALIAKRALARGS